MFLSFYINSRLTEADTIVLHSLYDHLDSSNRLSQHVRIPLQGRNTSSSEHISTLHKKCLRASTLETRLIHYECVLSDIRADTSFWQSRGADAGSISGRPVDKMALLYRDHQRLGRIKALNDPNSDLFAPTVFLQWDIAYLTLPDVIQRNFLEPYVRWAQKIVRNPTDVVMVTHLILYLTTSLPSMLLLFSCFSWIHGSLHLLMQAYFAGTYTLMMHQHIHMHGILAKEYAWFDHLFPYITDPLMGHTWNSYYYHHVKQHHVENNGPDDISSTLRYQRDSVWDFTCYLGRFFFLVWLELPLYFARKWKWCSALKSAGWELGSYAMVYLLARHVHLPATFCSFILPLLLMRLGLMVGNWGQHAFVDDKEPNSNYRSSITLIDVAVSSGWFGLYS